MAHLSLIVEPNVAPIKVFFEKLGLAKPTLPPVIDIVIDPDTDAEQFITLQPQKEEHLIPLTPGKHVVAAYDPDREKHVEASAKAGGVLAGLSGFALGAALGGSQGAMDTAAKGFSKVIVGDPVKRWEKAFKRYSVKEFEVQEGETVSYNCQLNTEQGVVCLNKEGNKFWGELLLGLWLVLVLASGLGVALELDLVLQGVLAAIGAVIVAIIVWKKKQQKKQNPGQNHGAHN